MSPAVPDRWTSFLILSTSIAIFAASWWTFGVLVGRSTEQRHIVAMSQWGRERGIRFRTMSPADFPGPLKAVVNQRLTVKTCLASKRATLMMVETTPATAAPGALSSADPAVWNFLIVETPTPWPTTALRPVSASTSAVDLFSLSSFPLLGGSERFVLFGVDSIAAAALTRSSARGLLPADIGLVLHGRRLLLDFSSRPFDTVEFERMLVVARQIVEHLPDPG
jgi:hypothetical protein